MVGAWFTAKVFPVTTASAVVQLVVGVTALATEPAPKATLPARLACAPLPKATLSALLATAFGAIATLSRPVAWLSAPVLLAWKYLMPWLLILLMASPTLVACLVVPSAL